jgi:hypothetical protein
MQLTDEQPANADLQASPLANTLVEGQTVRINNRGRGNLVSQPIPGIWVVAFSEMQGCGYVFESELSAV